MPKKSGLILIVAGAALMISALSLYLYNSRADARAAREAQSLMPELIAAIDARTESVGSQGTHAAPAEAGEQSPASTPEPMTVVDIGVYGYIGYLTIPKLELEVPIMSEWDYSRLEVSPCRQSGSTRTDDLVLAAHNYWHHFGRLNQLEPGDAVNFTDMDGELIEYLVTEIDTLSPDSVEAVCKSGHDLVLYTCTYGGKTRVTVFCDRIQG